MATIEKKGNGWYGQFLYQGRRRYFTIGRVAEAEARAKADQVGYLVMRLNQGLIHLPPGVDVVDFVKSDGAAPKAPAAARVTLQTLQDRYLETHEASLEPHTLRGIRRHFRHLAAHLGPNYAVGSLTLADLQGYVDKRAKAKWRRKLVQAATIKKEIVSLRTAWNWGVRMELVQGPYPYKGLRYAKAEERPPFQTRAEIERQLPNVPSEKRPELWECLYLTLPELDDLLAHVEANAPHPWIHPLVAAAAHTGARKGELLRMKVSDVDFDAGVVTVREKKRAHDRRTTRRVPLSEKLAAILRNWLKVHPGGEWLFAQAEEVGRSKKRSRTTGHVWKDRPGVMKERLANVRERERPGVGALTEFEAHDHVKRTLKGSPWAVVRGLHTLRHSFISACAAKGVDQRFIDEWVGHSTDQQRRRYRHLAPDLQAEKLKSVFGQSSPSR